MDRRLSLLALLLLAGCGKEEAVVPGLESPAKMEGHKLVMLTEDWAMPEQTPLSIGFWGSTADLQAAVDPWKLNKGNPPHNIDVLSVLRSGDLTLRTPETDKKLADPSQRGFVRVIPRFLIGVTTGKSGGLKLNGAAGGAGVIYWLEPRKPEVPEGWTLAKSSVRIEEIPLKVEYAAIWGGRGRAQFSKQEKWDLKKIDLSPERAFSIGSKDAYDSPYSKWSEKRPSMEEMPFFEMEPLVVAQVMSYTLKETATGRIKTGELLTGWVEGAGRFIRRGSRPHSSKPVQQK